MSRFRFTHSRSLLAARIGLLLVLAMILTLLPSGIVGADQGVPPTANPKQFRSQTAKFAPDGATPVPGGVILDNGTVQLGINPEGHLNVDGGTPSSGTGTTWVGIRYMSTNAESIAPGCLCEGWGVADALSNFSGWASIDNGGIVNVTSLGFDTGVDLNGYGLARCVVQVGSTFSVTHDYHPSASPFLYEVTVTIENISAANTDVRYRRTMDWDVEPTAFSEYVTVYTGGATNVLYSSDDGFAISDPLAGPSFIWFEGEAVDSGPGDHGALFDFGFGLLPPGGKRTFQIYYGAAGSEKDALNALATVGAEVYSLGQPSSTDGPTLGTPNTFIFGFKGVGGKPVGNRQVLGWVFLDNNVDGWRQAAETAGLANVKMTLKATDDSFFAQAYSIASAGWYQFVDVPAGDYCLTAEIPATHVPTTPTEVCFTLAGDDKLINFGVRPGKATISDFVWEDMDGDGVQDAGEPGIPNVTLALWDESGGAPGSVIQTTTTDANGLYSFEVLPGTYFVQVTDELGALAGLTLTSGPQSKPNPFGPITVADGEAYQDADFGYTFPCGAGRAIIGGWVWHDMNGDNVQDAGEQGIAGVTVCAEPISQLATRCARTNYNGIYRICVRTPPYTYLVSRIRIPGDPVYNMTPTSRDFHLPVVVKAGVHYLDADFGYR